MPTNRNPQILNLLSWHGHSGGGVHVPFQVRSNPLNQIIETTLVGRLRQLATGIAADPTSRPRWIFLVGGPGNGKSEAVQAFLSQLDSSLGAGGALVGALTQKYSQAGLLPRKVEILPGDLGAAAGEFTTTVGRLAIVQDATATETAMGNAAKELATDLADLMTSPTTAPMPVFVACANRGLLARAMNEAFRDFGPNTEVTRLLANVIQASSLGREMLAGGAPCWPLQTDDRFACWPLDVESLLANGPVPLPLDFILSQAVNVDSWEAVGRCQDCASRGLCPFRQSAEWLRDEATKKHLFTFLRRGELARGQRWTFRSAFSLVAELLVGQWSDFEPSVHPCDWVHDNFARATATPSDASSVLGLAAQLYPHALFRGGRLKNTAAAFLEQGTISPQNQPLTHKLVTGLATLGDRASMKPIREMLAREYHRLDPGTSTPPDPGHPLRLIEDEFCQSVEQGRSVLQHPLPSPSEDLLFSLLEKAEEEWNVLGRESATAIAAVGLIRKIAAMVAKRSAGLRLGHHALDDLLAEYEASLRDLPSLRAVCSTLQPLIGDSESRFNPLEILGQPTAEREPLVSLHGPAPGISPVPAPVATASTPGHDMPCITFTEPNYRVPLTFDFFMTLRLRRQGCAGSSLPASVRAALDRIRHRFAGDLCRKDSLFVDGRASIILAAGQRVSLPSAGSSPVLVTE